MNLAEARRTSLGEMVNTKKETKSREKPAKVSGFQ